MTSLQRDIAIAAQPDHVWDALRDVGRPHDRAFPGVLVDSTFDGEVRTVTFADGFVARERIVDVDDEAMRVAYTVIDGPFSHHHASMQVHPTADGGSRVVWTTDLLPDELGPIVEGLVDAGARAMQDALRD